MRPLVNIVDALDALAVYHLAMGSMHEAIAARRTITRRQAESICDFAVRGCSDERK